jgi:F-type H+-transporting ATPase subunit b
VPQLDPTWFASQLFWLFVCFSLLYVVLSRIILPPLQNVIATRNSTIENGLMMAQDLKAKAEESKIAYENILIKSRQSAQSLISDAEIAAKLRAEDAIKALDQQIAVQSSNASAALAEQKKKFLDELMPETLEFSSMIVEKLTGQVPSQEQVKAAVNNAKLSEQNG